MWVGRWTLRSGCEARPSGSVTWAPANVLVTRAGDPALALLGDEAWELAPADVRGRIPRGLRRHDDGGDLRRARPRERAPRGAGPRRGRRGGQLPPPRPRHRAPAGRSRSSAPRSSFAVSRARPGTEARGDRREGSRPAPPWRSSRGAAAAARSARAPRSPRDPQRPPPVRGVGVAREDVDQPASREGKHSLARPLRHEVRGRRLDQGARPRPGRPIRSESRRRGGAPGARSARGTRRLVRRSTDSSRESPSGPGRGSSRIQPRAGERDRAQLLLVEPVEGCLGDLPAGDDLDRHVVRGAARHSAPRPVGKLRVSGRRGRGGCGAWPRSPRCRRRRRPRHRKGVRPSRARRRRSREGCGSGGRSRARLG